MFQQIYLDVYDFFGGNEFLIYTVSTTVVAALSYFSANFPFIVTFFLQPEWALKYRLQQEDKPVSRSKYLSAFKVILPNLFIVNPLFAAVLSPFYRKSAFSPENFPGAARIFMDLICCMVVAEAVFYYSHRFFHHPAVYKHIHKLHHEFTAPVSIVSIYAHPLEHALGNMATVLLGPIVCGAHVTVLWLWLSLVHTSTTWVHSGYDLPVPRSPKFHDYHHQVFNENYGLFGWLDRLHGTSRTFLSTIKRRD